MILYELKCNNEHSFEAWFKDGATFDRQAKSGKIECPQCADISITKAPMAPSLTKSRRDKECLKDSRDQSQLMTKEVLKAVKKVQKHIQENCDYVGDKFAEEAKAIHYGEAEERGIYGEATSKETSDLIDQEIPFYKIPWRHKNNS